MGRNWKKSPAGEKRERSSRKRYSEIYNTEKRPGEKKVVEIHGGRENEGEIGAQSFENDHHLYSEHFEIYLGENILCVNSTKGFTRVKSLIYNSIQGSLLDIKYRNPQESRPRKDIEKILRSKKEPEGNGIEGELWEIRTLIEKIRAQKSLKRRDYSV